tara:strand:- start:6348 stop:7631 length:1284 start_codon:yes stop_codon:yes gene_type:complete
MYSIKNLKEKKDGEKISILLWVQTLRNMGKISFISARDGTGQIQVVVTKETKSSDSFENISIESAIHVEGLLKKDSRSKYGMEIKAEKIKIINESSNEYPIQPKEHSVGFLLENRHLWIRTPKQAAVLRIRSTIEIEAQNWLDSQGYYRVDSPILTPNACEGTTTLFNLEYFEEEAYLSQSGQLYNEATALALGKVYCFGPTFRAEKSKTRKHLTEFWMLEPEAVGIGLDELLKLQENLFSSLVNKVLEKNADELKILERDISKLQKIKTPFPRVHYVEALKILEKLNFKVNFGSDFGAEHEEALAEHVGHPFFITNFPSECKAFYMAIDPEDERLTLSVDLVAPEGGGEITGGAVRIADPSLLIEKIKEEGLDPEVFSWYHDLRKYGGVQTAGFGMGLERMVRWVTGIHHVRATIPFPRTIDRISP